jgi:uncharacterized membrane protein
MLGSTSSSASEGEIVSWVVAVPSALASGVEFVEAFTIVLAVGITRGWRSALAGTFGAVLVLAAITGALGAGLLSTVPLGALKVIIGIFLLLFGLKWLCKAIMRFSGLKALHDEAETFREEVAMLSEAQRHAGAIDWLAASTSFNGVLLEGLEVVFIVVALGSASKSLGSATVGALAAAVIVIGAGVLLRAPMEKVPENTMKFVVGVMLSSFGTFWTAEGLGAKWWQGDWSILVLIGAFLAVSWVSVQLLRRSSNSARATASLSAMES